MFINMLINNVVFPAALVKYFEYVASLTYDQDPDYKWCQKLLETGLKDCKCSLEGKLDFSGKGTVKRGSPKKTNSTGPSCDGETNISDNKPLPRRKVNVTQKQNQEKQHKADISDSNSSAESDDDEVCNYKKKEKSSNANKKVKTKSVSCWRDCPSAIASNVNRAGEYKRKSNEKQHITKKQRKMNV